METVIYDIERCICHMPDACKDCSHCGHGGVIECMEELLSDALTLLKEQPELVRCKDCKFGGGCQNAKGMEMIACFNDDVFLAPEIHEPDWYCADGERKQS